MRRQHLEGFTQYLVKNGYRWRTASVYLRKVHNFCDWLEAEGRSLDSAALLAYRDHLRRRHAPSTVRGSLAALVHFFEYAMEAMHFAPLPRVPPPLDVPDRKQGRRTRRPSGLPDCQEDNGDELPN
jgi:site-specific recombinase XerD